VHVWFVGVSRSNDRMTSRGSGGGGNSRASLGSSFKLPFGRRSSAGNMSRNNPAFRLSSQRYSQPLSYYQRSPFTYRKPSTMTTSSNFSQSTKFSHGYNQSNGLNQSTNAATAFDVYWNKVWDLIAPNPEDTDLGLPEELFPSTFTHISLPELKTFTGQLIENVVGKLKGQYAAQSSTTHDQYTAAAATAPYVPCAGKSFMSTGGGTSYRATGEGTPYVPSAGQPYMSSGGETSTHYMEAGGGSLYSGRPGSPCASSARLTYSGKPSTSTLHSLQSALSSLQTPAGVREEDLETLCRDILDEMMRTSSQSSTSATTTTTNARAARSSAWDSPRLETVPEDLCSEAEGGTTTNNEDEAGDDNVDEDLLDDLRNELLLDDGNLREFAGSVVQQLYSAIRHKLRHDITEQQGDDIDDNYNCSNVVDAADNEIRSHV